MSEKKRKMEGEVYSVFKKRKPAADDPGEGSNNNATMDEASANEKLLAFKNLLDFSLVHTEEEIASRFDRIAKALMHEFRLVVRRENAQEMELEILEAEFYLQVAGCHEDPFTHGSEEQRVSGRWYVQTFSHQDFRTTAHSI
jgi:hypothetical protein